MIHCYYTMIKLRKICVLLSVPLLVAFSSCSARIEGVVREGGAAEISLKTSLEMRTHALISSLRDFMGDESDAPILDGPSISRSMAAAPGIRSVSLGNTGPAALEGDILISDVNDFLATGTARFITFTEGQDVGSSSIVINLDRAAAPQIISRLSPEVEEYLAALLAPVVLGEVMPAQEYIALVTMVYGRPQAQEIAAAKISVSIEFPRPPTVVLGGTASGRRAEFEIPLVDLLVLETPLLYEVHW